MIITAGSSKTGLPAIQNLAASVSLGLTTITWKVAHEQTGTFQFGLWFSAISPVNTSGPPDQVVAYYQGVGDYQASRSQVASEFVAVVAISGSEKELVAEGFLPWGTMAPHSPQNQHAYPNKPAK